MARALRVVACVAVGLLAVTAAVLAVTARGTRRQLSAALDEADFYRRSWVLKLGQAKRASDELAVWRDLYDTWQPPPFAWTQRAPQRKGIDVLVIGATPGGVGAALAAARMGARVTLTDEHSLVGGVWTAEGVSVPDEGWQDWPSETKGVLGRFQRRVCRFYRDDLKDNYLSSWPFLPWDGADILLRMLQEARVDVRLNVRFLQAITGDGEIVGARFRSRQRTFDLYAPRVVDATWNGDVAISCGCQCKSGRECQSDTHELWAPRQPDALENAISYVLIVKDTRKRVPAPKRPPGYDPQDYGPGVPWWSPEQSSQLSLCRYGRLPRGYVMINWPDDGNDLEVRGYCTACEAGRKQIERQAKARALGFWYYLKTDPGYARDTRNWDLAREFGTPDRLPLAPYHRSGRRIRCDYMLNAHDVCPRFKTGEDDDPPAKVFDDAIALGDYAIDTHGDWPNRPRVGHRLFTIPYRSLLPHGVDNLIMGDMAIGATFLGQSAVRLQPTRMRIGEAAGTAAAASLKLGVVPRELDPEILQKLLQRYNLRIYPPGTL